MTQCNTEVSRPGTWLTIDDFSNGDLTAANGARWRAVSDRVMGGVSRGRISAVPLDAVPDVGAHTTDPDQTARGGVNLGSDVDADSSGNDRTSAFCLHLSGDVSLDNNGGFIQAALDLGSKDTLLDASRFSGLRLRVTGNGEQYVAALRTPDCVRPWQSYRAGFVAQSGWHDVTLPFAAFAPHRLEPPLDTARLLRLGLLAIGREFRADLHVAGVWLYAD